MKQFKSLLTRDVSLNRWSLLLPVIGVAVCYIFLIIIDLRWGIDFDNVGYAMNGGGAPFNGLVGVIIGNILLCGTLLSLAVLANMTPNALNDNIKNNCEIFYKCLPVAPWKIVASKVVSTIIIPVVTVLCLALFNTWVAFLFLGHTDEISLGVLLKFTSSLLIFSFPYILLFGSFFIFLSGILKKKVLPRFLGVFIGVNILMEILRSASGIRIGTLGEYLKIWLLNPSLSGKQIINLELVSKGFMNKITLNSGINEISNLIAASVFSWDGVCLIIASAILLTGSACAYKLRKLD